MFLRHFGTDLRKVTQEDMLDTKVCCSVLQCVAVCCSVLQCVIVSCSALHCVAVCCSVLQCVAVCCSVSQCVAKDMFDIRVCRNSTHAHVYIMCTYICVGIHMCGWVDG